ncbi:MAG: glycosyltransferase family 39 protein [Thermodesulfovibrionales bacterium]
MLENDKSRRNTAEANDNECIGNKDFAAAGIFFLYCCLYAVLRLSISSTMEMDESEQFLDGSFLAFGYARQPPFYSWLVYGMAKLFGLNIQTIIATKYIIMFFFCFSFYLIARSFWNMRTSLLITGTLLIFPTYSYEFNRDLSHSILVTTMASITCYIFVRLLRRGRTSDYLLLGASTGIGFLSKYNFAFFLLALLLAALSLSEGRRAFFNKKIFLSFTSFVLIVSPHVIWLYQNDFLPFRHSLAKADAGVLDLSSAGQIFHVIISSYYGVLVFLMICFIFFGFNISWPNLRHGSKSRLNFFYYLSLYGLTIPLLVIPIFKTGHFSERWLAPILFSLPLAVFSGAGMQANSRRFKLLGYLCIFIAVAIFAVRSFIGFFPDISGKAERVHTPFRYVSQQLRQELAMRGIDDSRDITIISGNEYLAANVAAWLPGEKKYLLHGDHRIAKSMSGSGVKLLLWEAAKKGEDIPNEYARDFTSVLLLRPSRASFLHSSNLPPFVLGAALVQ